jgi:protein involved in polysaccharide export with SLBB domain
MRVISICGLALATVVLAGADAGAQDTPAGTAGRFSATRTELEDLATRAEAAATSAGNDADRESRQREASALRARLRDGDFEVGDHVAVFLRGDTALTDTFTVETGRTLALPNIPAVSLVGVLRSELQSRLAQELAGFLKDTAALRAKALVQFGVLGEVARPGYYLLPVNVPLTDAIMAAGGATTRADMPKTVVRRGSREVLSKGAVRNAMVGRRTLEELGLVAGDEIVVGAKREWGWPTIASVATGALALFLSVRDR